MSVIVIFGAGQIGSAVYKLLRSRVGHRTNQGLTLADTFQTYQSDKTFAGFQLHLWDSVKKDNVTQVVDVDAASSKMITSFLKEVEAEYVVNAMPFMFNDKIAKGAVDAGCHYIDFTEDDDMASKVRDIYAFSDKTCAVKCGLAPGYINYIGHDLVSRIARPNSLMISVGALPRHVNFNSRDPASNYNLSWSVDGLVNEYIRPCEVRINGKEMKVVALTGQETVLVDGIEYEAAFTSGGVGSLVKELKHVPNVYYKTLRYPGHYEYVRDAVNRHHGDFDAIRKEFLQKFPINRNDVIVVFAEAKGWNEDGQFVREVFAERYIGANGLSAIQCTTAGGGLAVLEMIVNKRVSGIIGHNIPIGAFRNTESFMQTYFVRT
jgi:saccharopine dehydrogenase-like NADP-dependent oxidoreductase